MVFRYVSNRKTTDREQQQLSFPTIELSAKVGVRHPFGNTSTNKIYPSELPKLSVKLNPFSFCLVTSLSMGLTGKSSEERIENAATRTLPSWKTKEALDAVRSQWNFSL